MFWRRRTSSSPLLPIAALISQTGEGRGDPPSASEFRALRENTLTAERRAEIESQIAHDPAVFSAFMRFAVSPPASASVPRRAGMWLLSPMGLSAAASVAVCAVALSLLLSSNQPSPSQTSRTARQVPLAPAAQPGTPLPDWRLRAVRHGMENPGWLASSPSPQGQAFGDACGGGNCDAELDALTDFGALVAGLAEKCAASTDPAVPLDATRQRRQLDSLLRDVSDGRWRTEMQQMARALTRPSRESCPAVTRLLRVAGANKN